MESCKEESFTAEKRRLNISCLFDFKPNTFFHGNDASGIDMQCLTGRQFDLANRATRVQKDQSIAGQLLHDEALATEQAGENLLLKVDADLNAPGGAQKAVLLTDDLTIKIR